MMIVVFHKIKFWIREKYSWKKVDKGIKKEKQMKQLELERLAQRREMPKRQSLKQREKTLLVKHQRGKRIIMGEFSEVRKTRLFKKHLRVKQLKKGKENCYQNIDRQREVRLLNKRKQNKKAVQNESPRQRENKLTQNRQNAYHNRLAKSQENCSTKKLDQNVGTTNYQLA